MKKQILNLGKQLGAKEKKNIFGGTPISTEEENNLCLPQGSGCFTTSNCCSGLVCSELPTITLGSKPGNNFGHLDSLPDVGPHITRTKICTSI